MLGQMSKGKDFLNRSPIPAAPASTRPRRCAIHHHGGYVTHHLEWAERNLRLNGLTGRAHRLMQADVLGWLRESTEQFDLILSIRRPFPTPNEWKMRLTSSAMITFA